MFSVVRHFNQVSNRGPTVKDPKCKKCPVVVTSWWVARSMFRWW